MKIGGGTTVANQRRYDNAVLHDRATRTAVPSTHADDPGRTLSRARQELRFLQLTRPPRSNVDGLAIRGRRSAQRSRRLDGRTPAAAQVRGFLRAASRVSDSRRQLPDECLPAISLCDRQIRALQRAFRALARPVRMEQHGEGP